MTRDAYSICDSAAEAAFVGSALERRNCAAETAVNVR